MPFERSLEIDELAAELLTEVAIVSAKVVSGSEKELVVALDVGVGDWLSIGPDNVNELVESKKIDDDVESEIKSLAFVKLETEAVFDKVEMLVLLLESSLELETSVRETVSTIKLLEWTDDVVGMSELVSSISVVLSTNGV